MKKKNLGLVLFYINVGQLPPFKAEAFIDRLQDRSKEQINICESAGYTTMWIPVRDSATRVEVLKF